MLGTMVHGRQILDNYYVLLVPVLIIVKPTLKHRWCPRSGDAGNRVSSTYRPILAVKEGKYCEKIPQQVPRLARTAVSGYH